MVPTEHPILHVEAAIGTGFISEEKETSGINHLLEHVLTEGWKKCGKKKCGAFWSDRGVDMNATTSGTLMTFYTKGLKEDLEDSVAYICSITDHPEITEAALRNEKPAVVDEMSSYGNSPLTLLDSAFQHAFYTAGRVYEQDWKLQIANLKHLTLEKLNRLYREQFNPANVAYMVVGKFSEADQARILQMFRSCFMKAEGGAPRNVRPDCFTYAHKIIYVGDADSKVTTMRLGFPTSDRTTEENLGASVMVDVLHDLLFDELRTHLHLIYNIDVNDDTDVCGGVISIEVEVTNDHFEQVWYSILKLLKKYRSQPFPDKNVKAAKKVAAYDFYKKKMPTYDYLEQMMVQVGSYRNPELLSREQKYRKIKKMCCQQITDVYRKLCRVETALCVYQGPKRLDIRWD